MEEKSAGSLGDIEHRLYLIDASIYIFRYYFSMPDHWQSDSGYPTAAVYGYSLWLARFLAEVQPTFVATCFDESLDTCFRNDIYPDYKSSRGLPDEDLAFQLAASREITELFGVPTFASKTHEADDLIGTLAQRWYRKRKPVTIISRDKDLGQLIARDHDQLWDFPDGEALDICQLREKWKIDTHQIPDYLALVGDPIDDIPGVPGLGPKTAVILLQALGSWRNIKQDFDKVTILPLRAAARWAEKLSEYSEQIDMALKLTKIDKAAPLTSRVSVKNKQVQFAALENFSRHLGFGERYIVSIKNKFANI